MGALYASASVFYNGAGETSVVMNQKTVSVKGTPTKKALSKDERAEYQRLLAARNEADEGVSDIVDFYRAMLLLTAADKVAAEDLLNNIGDDAAVLDTLVTLYFERTQVGEA